MSSSSAPTAPLTLHSFGKVRTRLNPAHRDAPDTAAYEFDTHHELSDSDIARFYNRGEQVFAIGADGSLISSGNVGGNVTATGGSLPRDVRDRFAEPLSLLDFTGADRTGATDNATVLATAAAAAVSGSKRLRIPKGTYKINSQFAWPSGLEIIGDGPDCTTLDFSSGASAIAILGEGSLSALPALSGTVAAGATSITFASAHGLAVGDVFIIHNTTTSSFSTARTFYKDGEFCEVATVSSSTVVTLKQPTYSTYSGGSISNWKLNPFRGRISGLKMTFKQGAGSGIAGIKISYGKSIVLHDLDLSGSQYGQVLIDRCYDVHISRGRFFDAQSTIGNNYGAVFANCQKVRIVDCAGETTRHVISFGGGSGDATVPNRDLQIDGGDFSTTGLGWGLDFHGNCEEYQVSNVRCKGGIAFGGDRGKLSDSVVGNFNDSGYAFVLSEIKGANFRVKDNDFYANRNFDNGLLSLYIRADHKTKSELVLEGNTYDFKTFRHSTYSTGDTSGVKFGVIGTPISDDVHYIFRDETFTTEETTAGPTYCYYATSATNGIKRVTIDGVISRKAGIRLYHNIQKLEIKDAQIRDSLQHGIYGLAVTTPTYAYQEWYIKDCFIENSQQDGIRLLQDADTDDIILQRTTAKNNGQGGGGTWSSIVVSNARRCWLLENNVGDDQAVPTQTYLGVIQGVLEYYKRSNEDLGRDINSLDWANSSITSETDLALDPQNRVIATQPTVTANVGTAETDLATVTLPADTLWDAGDQMVFEGAGLITGSANNKRIKVYFEGATIFDSGSFPAASTLDFTIRGIVTRPSAASSTVQNAVVEFNTSSATTVGTPLDYTTNAQDLSTDLALRVTGQGGADNEVFLSFLKMRFLGV